MIPVKHPGSSAGLLCLAALALAIAGCAGAGARATRLAQRGGMQQAIVRGSGFRHQLYWRHTPPLDLLYVFVDGDGVPWTQAGTVIAGDPTPRSTLALDLALATPHSTLYVGRPCYLAPHDDPGCVPRLWTAARYSSPVVDSMVAVVNDYASNHAFRRVILVGYSGGGTLALLMAPRIPALAAVVTIAADLDVAAWVNWHGYSPLDGSLDPADDARSFATLPQWHLVGGKDRNVPPSLNRRYFDHLAPERIWRFDSFDHTCCWLDAWPRIFARLDDALSAAPP